MAFMDVLKSVTNKVKGAVRTVLVPAAKNPHTGVFDVTPTQVGSALRRAANGEWDGYVELVAIFERFAATDAHLSGELDKLRRKSCGWAWNVTAAEEDGAAGEEIAQKCETWLRGVKKLRDTMESWVDAEINGIALIEPIGELVGAHLVPRKFVTHPLHAFRPKQDPTRPGALPAGDPEDWAWEMRTDTGWTDVPEGKLLVRSRLRRGSLLRGSLLGQLVWLCLFKNADLRWWTKFLEIYGVPLRVGKVPSGYQPGSAEWETVARAVLNAASDSGAVISEGMEIEFVSAMEKANADAFEKFARFLNGEMSKRILGGTLTSDPGQRGEGAQSLGDVQADESHDLVSRVSQSIAEFWTDTALRFYVVVNFGVRAAYPVFGFVILRLSDLTREATVVTMFMDRGAAVDAEYLYDRFPLGPKPEPGAEVVVARGAPVSQPGTPARQLDATLANARLGPATNDQRPTTGASRAFTFSRHEPAIFDGNAAVAIEPGPFLFARLEWSIDAMNDTARKGADSLAPIYADFAERIARGNPDAREFTRAFVELLAPALAEAMLSAMVETVDEARGEAPGLHVDVAARQAIAAITARPAAFARLGASFARLDTSGDTVRASTAEWNALLPKAALEFFESRLGISRVEAAAILGDAGHYAFGIAGVESKNVIDTAGEALRAAIAKGTNERDFQKVVNAAMDAAGLGRLSSHHLETVWRQNILTAYGAGRHAAQTSGEVLNLLPFGEWISLLTPADQRRPEHIALHGVVLPITEWSAIYPPQGFNCMCRIKSRAKVPAGASTKIPASVAGHVGENGFTNPIAQWASVRDAARRRGENA